MAGKVDFWKVLSFFAFISTWAGQALQPDEDGVVRITTDELAEFAKGMCDTFGWKAEIVVPMDSMTEAGPVGAGFEK